MKQNFSYVVSQSKELAELIGILLGDGHIGNYQISVTLNLTTDVAYSQYVISLFEMVFACRVSVIDRVSHNCRIVLVSSVECVRFFAEWEW